MEKTIIIILMDDEGKIIKRVWLVLLLLSVIAAFDLKFILPAKISDLLFHAV